MDINKRLDELQAKIDAIFDMLSEDVSTYKEKVIKIEKNLIEKLEKILHLKNKDNS